MDNLIESPCIFCGYNGNGYYQKYTHPPGCPWRYVGGEERRSALRKYMLKDMAKAYYEAGAERSNLDNIKGQVTE